MCQKCFTLLQYYAKVPQWERFKGVIKQKYFIALRHNLVSFLLSVVLKTIEIILILLNEL